MVLAIGIVVDDAIVVLENVERIMRERGHAAARGRASRRCSEVTGPVIAIVLVLCAVFMPVAFLGGITGELYRQFAVTIAVAVVISGIVALTLTPALCALLLKPASTAAVAARSPAFNRGFAWVTRALHRRRGLPAAPASALALVGFVVVLARWRSACSSACPGSFVPDEDQGYIFGACMLPDGATLERTRKVVAEVSRRSR